MANSGLCIGGPLDGTRLSASGTTYTVPMLPDMKQTLYENAPDSPLRTEDFTYYFTSSVFFHGHDQEKMGFWVGRNETILDAFRVLQTSYETKSLHTPLLKRILRVLRVSLPVHSEVEMREHRDLCDDLYRRIEGAE